MPIYRAILFDLDQTLLNRHDSLIQFCQWQAQHELHLAKNIAEQFVQRFIELDANGSLWKDQVYAELIASFQLTSSVSQLLQSYVEQFQYFCQPFPHVLESIQDLHRQGFELGLISNGKSPFQQHNFNQLGLSEFFSCIIVSEAVQLRKPDPKIFQLACQQLQLQPEQCIFIGDNELADIQGAQNAGLLSLRFYPPSAIPSLLKMRDSTQAHGYFDDFAALPKLIHSL